METAKKIYEKVKRGVPDMEATAPSKGKGTVVPVCQFCFQNLIVFSNPQEDKNKNQKVAAKLSFVPFILSMLRIFVNTKYDGSLVTLRKNKIEILKRVFTEGFIQHSTN